MSNTILLVFEGKKKEPKVWKSLQQHLFPEAEKPFVQAIYGTVIYQLWEKLQDSPYLDLVEVLREMSDANRAALADLSRDDIDQVYLFFDYDGHASNANDDKLKQMLRDFDNETERGKLYISYPMVESVQDQVSTTNVIQISDFAQYKKQVSSRTPYNHHFSKISQQDCYSIIQTHLCQANFMVNGSFSYPVTHHEQATLFDCQRAQYINPHQSVAVLSAFPFFFAEYFGLHKFLPESLACYPNSAP